MKVQRFYASGTALTPSSSGRLWPVEGRDLALKAKELDPDNPGVYGPIALYAATHGDWDGARRAAETRLSFDPKDLRVYANLAFTEFVMMEPERAIELLTQAINLNPKHPHEFVCF